jgi:predicted aspartyl protease
MRRIDALLITLGVFIAGGLAYWILQVVGLDSVNAGIWSQLLLILVILGWLASYVLRVSKHDMTYDQQRAAYEEAVLQQRLDDMTSEELAALQASLKSEEIKDTLK